MEVVGYYIPSTPNVHPRTRLTTPCKNSTKIIQNNNNIDNTSTQKYTALHQECKLGVLHKTHSFLRKLLPYFCGCAVYDSQLHRLSFPFFFLYRRSLHFRVSIVTYRPRYIPTKLRCRNVCSSALYGFSSLYSACIYFLHNLTQ